MQAREADFTAEYWRQHASLKAGHYDNVDRVHRALRLEVGRLEAEEDESDERRFIFSCIQFCASVLGEDKTTHARRDFCDLDKAYKYIVKIVKPYLSKLRSEMDQHSFTPGGSNGIGGASSNQLADLCTVGGLVYASL